MLSVLAPVWRVSSAMVTMRRVASTDLSTVACASCRRRRAVAASSSSKSGAGVAPPEAVAMVAVVCTVKP